MSETFKSGFITIAGIPNVGKSTLLNRMLGEKISITSKKPQTTRNRILGVLHRPKAQLIFIDTPGIHKSKTPLDIKMVEEAITAMGDVDAVLMVIDATASDPGSEDIMLKNLLEKTRPVILAINKIDLVKKPLLLELIDKWSKIYPFQSIIPVSAKHGTQVDDLITAMEEVLPQGPPLFPEDTLTDLPEKFIAAEMIREKVFRHTGQEIPYSTAVTIDSFKENENNGKITIHATIHVERDSQKGIIIGKKGSKLKQIGIEARKEIERMVGAGIFLKLFVRIQKNWRKDSRALRKLGY